MFNFLKEKLGSIFKKVKKDEEKVEEELEKIGEQEEKIEEKLEEVKKEEKKIEKEAKKEEIKEKIDVIEEKKEELKEELKEKKSIFQKLKDVFSSKLDKKDFEKIWDELEVILIESNVAMSVIESLKVDLEKELVDRVPSKNIDEILKIRLRENIESCFIEGYDLIDKVRHKKPFVIVFFGINGSGKTTTIAKVAHLLLKHNLTPVLAAADTFRAASIEQLEKHASKLKLEVVKHKYGADPAAVAFDAIAHAKARNIDVVLIDTAGRMHTKTDLMREMEKIVRVAKPDLRIFIGESITGNDAVEQAEAFNKSIGIDGIILSKADVDEKGGAMISISKVTGKPILYLGTGQEYKDLELFDKDKILKQIFD
jgi:fused signal recognition particle receptor